MSGTAPSGLFLTARRGLLTSNGVIGSHRCVCFRFQFRFLKFCVLEKEVNKFIRGSILRQTPIRFLLRKYDAQVSAREYLL